MKERYIAPNAETVNFQNVERLAADDDFVQVTGDYDNVLGFDDLIKPKGW